MEIYRGIAAGHCDHEDLIDFLNYVFGMNGTEQGFYRLLPKLYKPEYRPEDYNFVVTEDGKLRAAIGSYPIRMSVMGHALLGMGIGNVAVHPFHRGKGYMKDGMAMALEDMKARGADFAALGGQRQRYSYFGFEPAGLCARFTLCAANLRHALGFAGDTDGYTARAIGPGDKDALRAIAEMVNRQPSHPVRPEAPQALYDVLNTWESRVCVVDGPDGAIAGYFLAKDDGVSEIDCAAPQHARGVLLACWAMLGQKELALRVPAWSRPLFELLADIAENSELSPTECYTVLRFERVVRACLELKAAAQALPDGEAALDIDGVAGRETLRVAVRGGRPQVEAGPVKDAVRFTHRQAMNALFGLFSAERAALPLCAQSWFPLSLFVPEADND